jgi:hypothetical protein
MRADRRRFALARRYVWADVVTKSECPMRNSTNSEYRLGKAAHWSRTLRAISVRRSRQPSLWVGSHESSSSSSQRYRSSAAVRRNATAAALVPVRVIGSARARALNVPVKQIISGAYRMSCQTLLISRARLQCAGAGECAAAGRPLWPIVLARRRVNQRILEVSISRMSSTGPPSGRPAASVSFIAS